MSIFLGVAYLAGWILTTVLLLRRIPVDDDRHRGDRVVMRMVGIMCAVALAAVWPLSGWLLPLLRSALENPDSG